MSNQIIKKENELSEVGVFIAQAIEKNLPVETMERLFALKEKYDASKAREVFVEALATFQNEVPIIKKTKKVLNNDGRTVRYMFAPIDSIVEQIKKPLAKAGLSYRWETKQENGAVKAICIVTHKLGHSESSDFEIPVDTGGYMTQPQKYASALTFAKRYSLCNALGISTGDEDTDATDVKKDATAKSDKSKIIFLLKQLNKPSATKEQVEKSVKSLTQLECVDENFKEIVSRLETIVLQNNEDSKV